MRISSAAYVAQAPELVAEVSTSSASFDLHTKLTVYRRSGVCEYLVWRVRDQQFDWFVLRAGPFQPLTSNSPGLVCSEVFPGLWLDAVALLAGDMLRVLAAVQEGIATTEHATFVQRLQLPSAQP